MNAGRTARERARAELTLEIKSEARRQLATVGADGLSLRAVARELGMASSALYRYFAGRDDLLTALIVDAYGSLADALDAADREVRRPAAPRARFRAVCTAVRRWARAHPHEYALIYGSPVPGYRAPETTVVPAARVPLLILETLSTEPAPEPGPDAGSPLPGALADQLGSLRERFAPEMPEHRIAAGLMAWTQVFGIVSFELFGQLVGSVDPTDDFFAYAVERLADQLELPPGPDAP